MSWTDERVELLSKLWLDGRSASQIAAELGLGVTRNAVIGKVHRLGLAGRPKATAPVVSPPNRVKAKPTLRIREEEMPEVAGLEPAESEAQVHQTEVRTPAPVPLHETVVAPFSERVTIMDLRESSCRWPMGDPTNIEFRFCGARTSGGSGPYCASHSRLAFQPAPERRRDRVDRYARIA